MALYKCPESNGYKYRLIINISAVTPNNFTSGIAYTKNSSATSYSVRNPEEKKNNLSNGITLTTKWFNESTETEEGSATLSDSEFYRVSRESYNSSTGGTSMAAQWKLSSSTTDFTCTFQKTSGGIFVTPRFQMTINVLAAKIGGGSLGSQNKSLAYYDNGSSMTPINISGYNNGDTIIIGEITAPSAPQTASAGATSGSTYVCQAKYTIPANATFYMTATLEKVSA